MRVFVTGATGFIGTELASRGVRAMAIRLPPIVHGPNDGGFAKLLFAQAKKNRQSVYIGDGSNRWSC